MRILVVEDELHLAEALTQILRKNNYTVDTVNDGATGLDNALSDIYDLIILDIMLPKMDGISILKEIRKEGLGVPVILLTAKGQISDKVIGLDSGADDYLPKPFATEELLARIRALSRRKGEVLTDNNLKFGDIELNISTLMLTSGTKEVKLILKESQLLEVLMTRKNSTTSKELIIEKLWGFDAQVEHNHVEVYISFLRKKLVYLNSKVVINTVRGVGYILGEE
jgi:two-component system, OmpR family, response regulator ArlR